MAQAFTLLFPSNCFFCSWNYSEDMNSEKCRLKGHRQFPVMSMVATSCSWKERLTPLHSRAMCNTVVWGRTRQWLIEWRISKLLYILRFYSNAITSCVRQANIHKILMNFKTCISLIVEIYSFYSLMKKNISVLLILLFQHNSTSFDTV